MILLILAIGMTTFAQKVLKNPAAVYCETMGYDFTVQKDVNGDQVGMCTLPNGQVVNAWDFYKGKVAKEYGYPAKKGYNIETVVEKVNGYTVEKAVCTRTVKGKKEILSLEELMGMNNDELILESKGPSEGAYATAVEDENFTVLASLPTTFDWRNYNGHSYIGGVRNQGGCGSCYAFGASACAEGVYNVATGSYDNNTADFSESYIAWCLGSMSAYSSHFNGCAGADYSYAELQALCDIGAIPESYFPYSDSDNQSCPSAASNAPKTQFTSWYRVACSDIDAIKSAIITYGVVDAAVYATSSFDNYSGGIYSDSYTSCSSSPCYNTPTNHAIALVGWGTDATSGDYWILRNSWGSTWGEGGYMRIDATSARVACEVCYLVYDSGTSTTPTVSTNSISSITSTSAISGGNITANGGATVTASGIVYSTSTNPTLSTGTVISTSPVETSGSYSLTMSGLTANTTYYVRAYATNSEGTSYGTQVSFTTSTTSDTYCASAGNNINYEWIDLVKLNTINNVTTATSGYSDYTNLSTNLDIGASYTINFSAGFSSSSYTEYWYIWIDYDQDGTFETNELINSTSSSSASTLSKTFTVPTTAATGSTRMRVTMKYNSAPTACETFSYGEVEDYTIVINSGTSDTQSPTAPTNLASSNVTTTSATLSWTASSDNVGVTGYNVYRNGSLLGTSTNTSYNVSGLSPSTTYSFYVTAEDAAGNVSANSSSINITTSSDNVTYCASQGNSIYYEWIDLVNLNTINNVTTASSGYSDFTNLSTSLGLGTSNTIYFSAGFRSTAYTEYWYIWIDYDQDGTFESNELVVAGSSSSSATLSSTFTVPTTATLGSTRMRVSMKYNAAPTACEAFRYGEVEDYTVVITGNSVPKGGGFFTDAQVLGNETHAGISVYPNPANSSINVMFNNEFSDRTVKIYSSDGTLVKTTIMDRSIDISELPEGLYIISVDDPKGAFNTKFIKNIPLK